MQFAQQMPRILVPKCPLAARIFVLPSTDNIQPISPTKPGYQVQSVHKPHYHIPVLLRAIRYFQILRNICHEFRRQSSLSPPTQSTPQKVRGGTPQKYVNHGATPQLLRASPGNSTLVFTRAPVCSPPPHNYIFRSGSLTVSPTSSLLQ